MTIRRWRRGKSDFSRGADDLSGRIEVCKSMDLSLKSHMSILEYCVATFSMLGSCHIKINNDTSPISRRQYLPTSDRSVWSNFFFSQPRSLFSSSLSLSFSSSLPLTLSLLCLRCACSTLDNTVTWSREARLEASTRDWNETHPNFLCKATWTEGAASLWRVLGEARVRGS